MCGFIVIMYKYSGIVLSVSTKFYFFRKKSVTFYGF